MKEIDLSKYAPRTDLADEIVTSSKDTYHNVLSYESTLHNSYLLVILLLLLIYLL